MNLPNKITIARFLLVPCFLAAILTLGNRGLALGIFVVAALTDALDGYLARTRGLGTTLGSFLDPLADHLLITTSLIALTVKGMLPSWLMWAVITRDGILLVGGIVLYTKLGKFERIIPSAWGKLSSFFCLTTVVLALILNFTPPYLPYPKSILWLAGCAACFITISGVHYFVRSVYRLFRKEE
jgi:CDP-diacylglycerol--glycerol-3-phosphate 3-phosphatidyltransferase